MITLKVKKLKNIQEKSIGLIGKKGVYSVMFQTRFGIHTFFMNFPIDVLVLDKAGKVVRMKKGLKPNRIFFWPIKYDKVIEMSAGKIDEEKIVLGSKVIIDGFYS